MRKNIYVGVGEYTGNITMLHKDFDLFSLDHVVTELTNKLQEGDYFGIYYGEEGVYLEEVRVFDSEDLNQVVDIFDKEESYYKAELNSYVILGNVDTYKPSIQIHTKLQSLDMYDGATYRIIDNDIVECILCNGELIMREDSL